MKGAHRIFLQDIKIGKVVQNQPRGVDFLVLDTPIWPQEVFWDHF